MSKQNNLIYKALLKAIEADKLKIYIDQSRLNLPGSKVYNPWECLLPVLVPVLIGLLAILIFGIISGIIIMIALIIGSNHYFKNKFESKILERTKAIIIKDIKSCQELWDFGGIVFVSSDNKKLGCVAPEGDWKDFVVINFSQYMIEKKEEPKKDEKPKKSRR